MESMKVKKSFLVFLSLFVLSFVLASSVLAVSGKPKVTGKSVGVGSTRVEGKLRACQAKQQGVTKRMDQLEKMAENMLENFSAIQERVVQYYNEKVIPSGKTVTNYSTLIAEIQTKKTAVQTAIDQAKTNSAGFSCDEDNPKEQLKKFNEDMRAVKSALKNYRTSIRNLIVAVRSVTGQKERNVTVSPKPTKTKVNK